MKRRYQFVSFALIISALLLAACQPAATPAPTQAPAVVEQPTSEIGRASCRERV